MQRTNLTLQAGDSFVVSHGLEGVAVLRGDTVVGQNAQYHSPVTRTISPEVLAQRETRDNYSKYITRINHILGTVDPFNDHQKDLKPKGVDQLKAALALCNEALDFAHEPGASQLKLQNLRLGIYYRKALIEFNLNPDDASCAIATINKGLKEIADTTLNKEEFAKKEQDIFESYRKNLSRQREIYTAGIDVEQVIKLAAKYFTEHDKPRAIAILEEAFFKRGDIADKDLSFKSILQLVNKLVEFSLLEKKYSVAQSYTELGFEIIPRLKKDSQILKEKTSTELENFAKFVLLAYGDDQSHKSAVLLQKLKNKFPLNMTLANVADKASDRENNPSFQLAKVDKLKQEGKFDEAALLAIEQAPKFLDQVKLLQAALNLWLEKANGEFQLMMPDELVQSLKTLLEARFIGEEKRQPNSEDRVKRNYLLFAAGQYKNVLDNARQFIQDTIARKNEKEFQTLREHSFWLEIKSLESMHLNIGNQLKAQIQEEFPDSRLLNSLIN